MSDESMGELDELYQEVLLDHSKSAERRASKDVQELALLRARCSCAEAFNPLCGDEIAFYARKAGGIVAEVAYAGQGCAISQASASMAAQAIEGLPAAEASCELQAALRMLTGEAGAPPQMEDWQALAGVGKYPMRVKCATMAIRAALAAIELQDGDQIELGD